MDRDDGTRTDREGLPGAGLVVADGRIGYTSGRRIATVIAIGAMFIAVALVKPWGSRPDTPIEAAAVSTAPVFSSPPPSRASPTLPPTEVLTQPETWPVSSAADAPAPASGPEDPSVIGALAAHVGTWGIAAIGHRPSFVLDERWVDWSAVIPEPSTQAADRIATWPGTGICTGLPVVLDKPGAIAVTSPTSLAIGPSIEAWWSDGGRTAALDGSIRELPTLSREGLTVLERLDGTAWPSGRYEFHVGSGDRIVALVVCVAQSG